MKALEELGEPQMGLKICQEIPMGWESFTDLCDLSASQREGLGVYFSNRELVQTVSMRMRRKDFLGGQEDYQGQLGSFPLWTSLKIVWTLICH